MDASSNTDLSAFIDFCKSLDSGIVHTPEQAIKLYRSGAAKTTAEGAEGLGRELRALRAQIVASGAPLLDEAALGSEKAARRGDKSAAE